MGRHGRRACDGVVVKLSDLPKSAEWLSHGLDVFTDAYCPPGKALLSGKNLFVNSLDDDIVEVIKFWGGPLSSPTVFGFTPALTLAPL